MRRSTRALTRSSITKLMMAKLRRTKFHRKSEKLEHQIEQLKLQREDHLADEVEATHGM